MFLVCACDCMHWAIISVACEDFSRSEITENLCTFVYSKLISIWATWIWKEKIDQKINRNHMYRLTPIVFFYFWMKLHKFTMEKVRVSTLCLIEQEFSNVQYIHLTVWNNTQRVQSTIACCYSLAILLPIPSVSTLCLVLCISSVFLGFLLMSNFLEWHSYDMNKHDVKKKKMCVCVWYCWVLSKNVHFFNRLRCTHTTFRVCAHKNLIFFFTYPLCFLFTSIPNTFYA